MADVERPDQIGHDDIGDHQNMPEIGDRIAEASRAAGAEPAQLARDASACLQNEDDAHARKQEAEQIGEHHIGRLRKSEHPGRPEKKVAVNGGVGETAHPKIAIRRALVVHREQPQLWSIRRQGRPRGHHDQPRQNIGVDHRHDGKPNDEIQVDQRQDPESDGREQGDGRDVQRRPKDQHQQAGEERARRAFLDHATRTPE